MSTLTLFSILSFLFASMVSLAQAATQVILPLYAYPTESEWTIVESSLAEYPAMDFLIIINPSNGPETSSPNSDWQTGITKLKSYSNCQIIGYVATQDTGRAISDVESDVDMYAAWPASIRVAGIFFDEVTLNDVSYYSTLASYAKSKLSPGIVVLNPGSVGATEYFSFSQVMVYEDTYDNYIGGNVPGPPAGTEGASSIIIYSMPDSTDAFSNLLSTFVSSGYAAVYLTDDPATYQSLGNTWGSFCNLMKSAVGGSSSSSPALPPPPPPMTTTPSDPAPPATTDGSTPDNLTPPPSYAPVGDTSTPPATEDTTPTTTSTDSTPTDDSTPSAPETTDDTVDDDAEDDGDDDDSPAPSSSPPFPIPSHHRHPHHGWHRHEHRN